MSQKKSLSLEEVNLLADKTIEGNKKNIVIFEKELQEYESFKGKQKDFYQKCGFTPELIAATKNSQLAETELDPDVQMMMNYLFKGVSAKQAGMPSAAVAEPKIKRSNIGVSRRGKMI